MHEREIGTHGGRLRGEEVVALRACVLHLVEQHAEHPLHELAQQVVT